MVHNDDVGTVAIIQGMDDARANLRRLLTIADTDTLSRRSNGTRWTNEQLLCHMVFGYMVVRALLILVQIFGRLPPPISRGFAAVLNLVTAPFHVVNYWVSRMAALTFNPDEWPPNWTVLSRPCGGIYCGSPAEPGTHDELPHPMGPFLFTNYDPDRGLPLPNPALRFPPQTAQRTPRSHRWSGVTSVRFTPRH